MNQNVSETTSNVESNATPNYTTPLVQFYVPGSWVHNTSKEGIICVNLPKERGSNISQHIIITEKFWRKSKFDDKVGISINPEFSYNLQDNVKNEDGSYPTPVATSGLTLIKRLAQYEARQRQAPIVVPAEWVHQSENSAIVRFPKENAPKELQGQFFFVFNKIYDDEEQNTKYFYLNTRRMELIEGLSEKVYRPIPKEYQNVQLYKSERVGTNDDGTPEFFSEKTTEISVEKLAKLLKREKTNELETKEEQTPNKEAEQGVENDEFVEELEDYSGMPEVQAFDM